MDRIKTAAWGFAAGAAFMYFFDPARGKRRRAGVRDKAVAMWHDLTCEMDKARRDVVNRTRGVVATAKGRFADHQADADVLIQRVRARVGRIVSHPHAISVRAENGRIVLEGPVLGYEVERLLRAVRSAPGVEDVENRLEVHREADISSLQGGRRRESRSELTQQRWTPSLRVTAAGAGGALLWYGFRGDGTVKLAGVAGTALLARAIMNREFRLIVGAGGGPRAIEFDKTMNVCAPIEEVFAFWSNYSNFPRFMTHLKEVRDLGGGKSHWVAEGPAGVPVSWEAEVTVLAPNKLLEWRSLPGSRVETEGKVRFDANPDGTTRVTIRLCYNPPAGILGHYLASLFRADPKHEMDDDMVRFKSLIEMGKTRAHGARVMAEEVKPPRVSSPPLASGSASPGGIVIP